MNKINKETKEKLKYLGWNIVYMLKQYTPQAQEIILDELQQSMKTKMV